MKEPKDIAFEYIFDPLRVRLEKKFRLWIPESLGALTSEDLLWGSMWHTWKKLPRIAYKVCVDYAKDMIKHEKVEQRYKSKLTRPMYNGGLYDPDIRGFSVRPVED